MSVRSCVVTAAAGRCADDYERPLCGTTHNDGMEGAPRGRIQEGQVHELGAALAGSVKDSHTVTPAGGSIQAEALSHLEVPNNVAARQQAN